MLAILQNQVAIITGAAQGIGKGTAIRLSKEGVHTVLADIQSDKLEAVLSEVKAANPDNQGFILRTDVTSAAEVDELVHQTVNRLGKLDIVFNNAGVTQHMFELADTSDELFDSVVAINLRGVFNGIRAAARVMRDQRAGCIINTGSFYGKSGHPHFAVYCATKAAVASLTQSAAVELAPHSVRVNCIRPGYMFTEMHVHHARDEAARQGVTREEVTEQLRLTVPLARLGTPDDIAGTVVFLASKEGSYITGACIDVNGGVDVY